MTEGVFRKRLNDALLPDRFLFVVGANPQGDEWYTTTFWGLCDPGLNAADDQHFEDLKTRLGGFHSLLSTLRIVELGSYHYGYTLLPCVCDQVHGVPIIVHGWDRYPRHSAAISVGRGRPPGYEKETDLLLVSVYGGVLRAIQNPGTGEGGLRVGKLFLRAEPCIITPRA